MQIKIYAIPVAGGEQMLEEMNAFLRFRKIIQIEVYNVGEVQNLADVTHADVTQP